MRQRSLRASRLDLRRAFDGDEPLWRRYAEARDGVYQQLARAAEQLEPDAVVRTALTAYQEVPLVDAEQLPEHVEHRGAAYAFEDFLTQVGLGPEVLHAVSRVRPQLLNDGKQYREEEP